MIVIKATYGTLSIQEGTNCEVLNGGYYRDTDVCWSEFKAALGGFGHNFDQEQRFYDLYLILCADAPEILKKFINEKLKTV